MRPAGILVLLTIAALLAPRPALGQAPPVDVQVEADRQRVTVGDPITLEVIVRYDEGLSLSLPAPGEDFGDLEVLEAGPPRQRDLGGGRLETRLNFVVAAFRTGQLQLAPLPVSYTDAAGNQGLASSPALPITVESVIPPGEEPADIRDLKPQLSIPGGTPFWVMPIVTAGAVMATALLAAFAAWWACRIRARPRAAARAPLPEEVARRDLDGIASQRLVSTGECKTQYRLLSACLRRYISDRYAFPAFAFTTGELEEQMTARDVDRWQARLIAALLQECDQVQFGQYVPAAARAESDLTAAYEIVELTRPETAEEEPALT